MFISILKSKIGHARVTQAELHYEGSITVDENLLKAVDIIPGERVQVLNVNNGQRFDTYAIAGTAGAGDICLNGPAARLGLVGDTVMILSYAMMEQDEARSFQAKIIHVDETNAIKS